MQTENPTQETSLRYVKGIGPKRALALAKLGITTLPELFLFFPKRYEDRTRLSKISSIVPGEHTSILVQILSIHLRRFRRISILELVVGDDSGMLKVQWFNQPYLKKNFSADDTLILFGKVDYYKNELKMNAPEYEKVDDDGQDGVHTGRITPIYPLTSGLYQKSLRKINA